MKPTKKSITITELLEVIAGRTSSIEADKCIRAPIGCGGPAVKFKDELSKREYTISGLCQACQDTIFGRKR